jgi:hypothetical protein
MSLSCEKIEFSDMSLRITYPDEFHLDLSLAFIKDMDNESLRKMIKYISNELLSRECELI